MFLVAGNEFGLFIDDLRLQIERAFDSIDPYRIRRARQSVESGHIESMIKLRQRCLLVIIPVCCVYLNKNQYFHYIVKIFFGFHGMR